MSQVIRKYDSGGKTEKPKLFSISGLGDFDQNALIERGYRDVDNYISKKGLKGSMASNFRNAVQYMLEGINNGTLTMDAMGNFKDKTGRASSTGELDRKKFLGIKTGIKDTDNNAYGIAADYLHGLVVNSPKYKQPEKKIEKFNTNDYLTKEISKRWYGGSKIDFNNWFKNRSEQDRNALIGEIFSNADYNQLYNDYDWTDTGINSAEDLATRGKAFSTAISNNTLDNDDYNTFATLGGSDLDKFLKETPVQTEPTPEQAKMKKWEAEAEAAGATTPEAKEAFIQKKQKEEAARNAASIRESKKTIYDIERDAFFDDYAAKNPFKGTISGYVASNTAYNPEKQDEIISSKYGDNYGGFIKYMQTALNPKYFSGQLKAIQEGKDVTSQHLANNLDMAIQSGYLDDLGDGNYGIPGTYNYDNWSFISYNPSTKQYKETSMLANDSYKKLLAHPEYDKRHPAKKENGGVVKFQSGGDTKEAAYLRYKQQLAKKREESTKQRAESNGRTVEEQKIADRKPGSITSGDWTGEDYARLASIVADIGSMGAAYVPVYGTIASAGLGIGSSLANYGADLSENGFKWGDLGNLAVNLGLDTVGLVPGFGSAAKGSKILKTAVKYLPRVLATVSLANAPEVYQSVKKAMTPGTDLTVDDWRNIAEGFKMVLQGGKGLKRTIQAHNLKKDLATGNSILTTLGGKEVTLTPAELSEIRSHRKIEDQQAALQLLKNDNNLQLVGDLNKRWFNPSRYLPNSNIRNEYDFGKTVKKRTSQGLIEVPRVYSNSDKYIASTMQEDISKIPGFDELSIRYNDWKYGVKSQKPKSEPTKSTKSAEQVKSTALVPTGKRNEHVEYNNEVQGYERDWRRKKAESINQNRLKIDDSRDYRAGIVPREGSISKSEGVDAKQVRAAHKFSNLVSEIADEMAKPTIDRSKLPVLYRGPVINIPSIKTLVESPTKVNYKGISEGLESATKQRLAKDIADTRIERSVAQNVETVARRQAKDAKKNVEHQIALSVAQERPKRALTGAARRTRQNSLNQVFNSRYYDVMDALRNKPNPTKQKNKKKKKTSRDDRVTKKAEGGVVQFLQDGKTVGRIKAKDMSNWNRANALANYNWVSDIDRWKQGYTGEDDWQDAYMAAFNGGEDIYDQLSSKTGDYFGDKYNYTVQDPLAKHRQITFRGTNQGFDDLIRNGIVGYGTTEGKTGFDIYAGDRTGNRTLARGMSPEDVARFNEQLATRGMELYDKGNGTYRLRRLEQKPVELPEVVVTAPALATGSRITLPDVTSKKFSINPEDALALGRMVGGLVTNNKAAKLYKEGLKPTLLDTFENTVPLQGNFQAVTNAEQQAGNLESVAARPRTSDASLQLAGELEASGKAGQARFQGGLQDAEMFYKTRMLGQQESDAAKARRVEVANKNRAAINAIDAAKKQIDAGRVTANYQKVIAPWLAGVENQFVQRRAMNQQLNMEEAQREAERTYSPEFDRLTQDYNNAYKAYGAANNNNYTGWETSNEYKSLVSRRKSLNNDVSQFLLDKRREILGSPYMFQVKKNSSIKTPYVKSGGKLSAADREKLQRAKDFNKRLLEDNKQFHKDIMESKREHNKLIMSMSSLTSELIKKAMS